MTGCTGGGGNGDGDGGDGNGTGDETGDGGNGDGGEEGELDGTGDGGGDGGDGDGGGGGSNPALSEAFGMTEEFAFDVESETEGQQMTMSGRFSQGNMYMQVNSEGSTFEFYNIGGDQYMVTSGQDGDFCMRNPERSIPDESQIDPGEYESTVSEYPDITASGTTTIDGEQVYIYELSSEMANRESVTYYVGVNSGYLRRIEYPDTVVNFHSWNDVGSIEAPDMECQDMSQMPGGPGGMPSDGSGMPSQP